MIGYGGAARIRDWSKANLAFAGNSLVAGVGTSSSATTLSNQVAALAPIANVITAKNFGISAQTIQQMDSNASGTDASYTVGKPNVLVVWEATNSIVLAGRTDDQTIGDLQTYIANRQANGRRWLVLVINALPRQEMAGKPITTDNVNYYNGQLASFNAKLAANYRAIGADAVVDTRPPGGPFALPDYSAASFALNDGLWNEPSGSRVHLTDVGYAVIAGYVAAAWPRMPLRNAS